MFVSCCCACQWHGVSCLVFAERLLLESCIHVSLDFPHVLCWIALCPFSSTIKQPICRFSNRISLIYIPRCPIIGIRPATATSCRSVVGQILGSAGWTLETGVCGKGHGDCRSDRVHSIDSYIDITYIYIVIYIMCVFLNRETPQPMGVGLFSFFQGVFGKSHTNIIYIYICYPPVPTSHGNGNCSGISCTSKRVSCVSLVYSAPYIPITCGCYAPLVEVVASVVACNNASNLKCGSPHLCCLHLRCSI